MLGKGLESLIPPQKNNSDAPMAKPAQQSAALPHSDSQGAMRPVPQSTGHVIPQKQEPRREQAASPMEKVFEPMEKNNQKRDDVAGVVYQLEVEKIHPNPGQPRRDFNEDALRDLASSIREFGILQPLVVSKIEKETPHGLDVEYQLIAGERRLMASKLLGLRVVPAIVRNVHLEREKLELAVIENIQRENLNPVETARAFQRLQEEFHLTQREIASKLGKSREAVANSVRLLDLPPYIQEALQRGDISESHGRLLLAIEDPAAQKKLFDDISLHRLTTRDVKERVERIRRPYGERDDAELTPEVRSLRESLSVSLGAPVDIKKNANNGKIFITFYSEEELENILRRLSPEQ